MPLNLADACQNGEIVLRLEHQVLHPIVLSSLQRIEVGKPRSLIAHEDLPFIFFLNNSLARMYSPNSQAHCHGFRGTRIASSSTSYTISVRCRCEGSIKGTLNY